MWFTLLIEAIGSDKNQLHAESVDQLELDVIKVLPHSFQISCERELVSPSTFGQCPLWALLQNLFHREKVRMRRVFGEMFCLTGCQEGSQGILSLRRES